MTCSESDEEFRLERRGQGVSRGPGEWISCCLGCISSAELAFCTIPSTPTVQLSLRPVLSTRDLLRALAHIVRPLQSPFSVIRVLPPDDSPLVPRRFCQY